MKSSKKYIKVLQIACVSIASLEENDNIIIKGHKKVTGYFQLCNTPFPYLISGYSCIILFEISIECRPCDISITQHYSMSKILVYIIPHRESQMFYCFTSYASLVTRLHYLIFIFPYSQKTNKTMLLFVLDFYNLLQCVSSEIRQMGAMKTQSELFKSEIFFCNLFIKLSILQYKKSSGWDYVWICHALAWRIKGHWNSCFFCMLLRP